MPINMCCPSCGKVLAAPDSAAGKRAKCPGCGQVMIVPDLAQQAGPADAPPPASDSSLFPPPSTDAGDSSLYDLAGANAGPQASASAPEGEQRRPCPECGEMIVAGAAKCRFCGAIFDPRLKFKTQVNRRGEDDSTLTALDWVLCVLCSNIGCIVGIVYAIQGKPKGAKMIGIAIAVSVGVAILSFLVQALNQPHFPPPQFH